MLELSLFLGSCTDPCYGEWIDLPMEKEKLEEKLDYILKTYGEYIIADYEKTSPVCELDIKEHSSIIEINEVIQKPKEYIALYIDSCGDKEFCEEMIKTGHFLFFEGATTNEEIGEQAVERGLLGYIRQDLIDYGYIDFEKIGRDFTFNGITAHEGLGAVGQISETDYNKYKRMGVC